MLAIVQSTHFTLRRTLRGGFAGGCTCLPARTHPTQGQPKVSKDSSLFAPHDSRILLIDK